jgi:multiple sugar transport system substrate-binding protein
MHRGSLIATLIVLVLSACQPVTAVPVTGGPTSTRGTDSASTGKAASSTPGATQPPESRIDVPPAALKGITIGIWHAWFGPAAALVDKQVAEFNGTNQWGITVQAKAFGTYNDLFDSVNTTLGGTNQPDVVVALPEQVMAWDGQRGVPDLTPYVDDPQWGLSKTDIADFPSAFWAQDQVGERRLGVPAARSAQLLFYNQSWARELGFSNPPTNAKEFKDQACAAHKSFLTDKEENNDGYGGWIVDATPETALSWLYAYGGGVLDANGAYHFRTRENQAALEFLKGLFDDKCAWLSTEPTPYEQFTLRRALFVTASLSELSDQLREFRLAASTDQWTVLPFPGLGGKVGLVTYGPSFTVLKSNEARQLAAWLFVRWMLSTGNQARWAETTGLFPLRVSSLAAVDAYRGAHPQWSAAVSLINEAQTEPMLASWRRVKHVLGDGFNALFRLNTPIDRIIVLLTQMDNTAGELTSGP